MWIMTNKGFFSAVEHKLDKNLLIVRARVKGHLESFVVASVTDIEYTLSADYLYRVTMTRDQFALAVETAMDDINYPNFKSSVRDDDLHYAYENVWLMMFALQLKKDAKARASHYVRYAQSIAGGLSLYINEALHGKPVKPNSKAKTK